MRRSSRPVAAGAGHYQGDLRSLIRRMRIGRRDSRVALPGRRRWNANRRPRQMPDCRRVGHPGDTWFLTANALRGHGNHLLVPHIAPLSDVPGTIRRADPFAIHAWSVLQDRMHRVIELPRADRDFALRRRATKAGLSRRLPATEERSDVRRAGAKRGIWCCRRRIGDAGRAPGAMLFGYRAGCSLRVQCAARVAPEALSECASSWNAVPLVHHR